MDETPDFPIGKPTGSSWRQLALARIAESDALLNWILAQPDTLTPGEREIASAVAKHLKAAYDAAAPADQKMWARGVDALWGAAVARTTSHLDAARGHLLQIAPLWYVTGQLPSLAAYVRCYLGCADTRFVRAERMVENTSDRELTPAERNEIVATFRDAAAEARNEVTRVRSFRNVLSLVALVLAVAAIVMAGLSFARPDLLPLCFNPESSVVCPVESSSVGDDPSQEQLERVVNETAGRWDILLVELVGLLGAAVAAAAALRRISGTSTPYSLPLALAFLKLPTGALTALLGLLLMRGQFVPGLTALDTPGQILAWAIVFGSAQHLVTRVVDAKAQDVLEAVGGQRKVQGNEPVGQPAAATT
jgi:hypothetical protein